MNEETYEALKRILRVMEATVTEWEEKGLAKTGIDQDIKQVNNWVDEVAKEYDTERKQSNE